MKSQEIQVKRIDAEDCKPLRHLVLWPHIEKEEDCNIDIDNREDAIHLGAYLGNEIVSVCSLFEMSNNRLKDTRQIRLRAMASHPDVRGTGAGRSIIEQALNEARQRGYDLLWCDARKVALGFYEKCGFDVQGDFYEVRNIGPHKLMYYKL